MRVKEADSHIREVAFIKMISRRLFLVMGALLAALLGSGLWLHEPDLVRIHEKIVADYTSVNHIAASELSALDPGQVVIFDVRAPKEFSVSHLADAVQVDPTTKPEDFMKMYKDELDGNIAIFYCSVGRRSSRLVERLDDVLAQSGVVASYNLIGGIYHWRNEDRPLMRQAGLPIRAIHPHNFYLARAIEDKSAIQYSPAHE